MKRQSGALRIFLYNWPIYLVTWAASLAVVASSPHWLLLTGAAVAIAWSIWSLAVSHYIYDLSELNAGKWIETLVPRRVERWVALDAGLDAEVELGAMPGRCVGYLDIFDPTLMNAASIQRARNRTARTHAATAASPLELRLADGSCDAATVIFSAHEIRDVTARETFFRELKRALRPAGTILLVEHLRDGMNFLAFGPGFFHFLPRSEWLRLAEVTGLNVRTERRVTPWVMALVLEKP